MEGLNMNDYKSKLGESLHQQFYHTIDNIFSHHNEKISKVYMDLSIATERVHFHYNPFYHSLVNTINEHLRTNTYTNTLETQNPF